MNDQHILELLWSRAESALDALAQRFGTRLYRTAMNVLNDPLDAEEAVNDTYLALWNAIPPERPMPLEGYVHRTGRNIALKKLRFLRAQKRSSQYDVSLDELAGVLPGSDLEDTLDAKALGLAIDRFLDGQNATSRVLFVRRYWFGDGVKELSLAMGMTESAVSVRLSRVRGQLKHYLNKEGFLNEP